MEEKAKAFRKAKKVGRPTIMSEELLEQIIQALLTGVYLETAVAMTGIDKATFLRWLKQGARDKRAGLETQAAKFCIAVKKAAASAEYADVMRIGRAAESGQWTASAWRLERKYPHRWGRTERVEVSGRDGGPMKTESVLSDEQLAKMAAVYAKSKNDGTESE